MDFTITGTSEGSAFLENPETAFLAIDSGLKNRAFVGVDTSSLQSLPGLIVANGEISNWNLLGITEVEGSTYFYGPYLKGKTLAELDLTPPVLLDLAEALHTIKDRNFPVRNFSLSSVFYCENGDILFFPPRLMEFLNSHRVRQNSMEMITPWNKPGLGGDAARAFTIASLAYKVMTGAVPFPGEDEEEIERLMSKANYTSPLLSCPRLNDETVSLLDQSFKGSGTLGLWRVLLKKWIESGIEDTGISEEDLKRRELEEQKKEEARLRKMKTAFFLSKNRSILIGIGAVIMILALIVQAPLSKYLAEPVTAGMNQEEVVRLYYSSFRTLDMEALEDTITSRAGKEDINEISTIYVTTRVRTSYEGSTGLLDPEEWIASGMEPVPPGTQVWGISGLDVRSLGNDIYEAEYIKWTPALADNPESTEPLMPLGEKRKDRIHLSFIKDTWVIDQIERIRE
ncbi:MAG: hypothetical protein JXR86_03960 [Spirochaetales bacterium]|nr:hypothetical protein [Spirochaetales bacterium]